jgi:transposase
MPAPSWYDALQPEGWKRAGREFVAWLGLVHGKWSTGGKAKLLGISKRGNLNRCDILDTSSKASRAK